MRTRPDVAKQQTNGRVVGRDDRRSNMPSPLELEKAGQCEGFFERRMPRCHCNCFAENLTSHPPQYNCSTLIDRLMKEQSPKSIEPSGHRSAQSEEPSSGGVAILLRGHAFRGASHDDMAARVQAQLDCSRSVQKHVIEPFVRMGERVHAYLTIYDTVEEALVHKLTQPYRAHLVGITTLRSKASGQVSAHACKLRFALDRAARPEPTKAHAPPFLSLPPRRSSWALPMLFSPSKSSARSEAAQAATTRS